jgi:Ser/Thr protein kinase RdoA (MazF antagonist)
MLKNCEILENSLIELNTKLLQMKLTRHIIHGDYGPYNLIFFKNKKLMVLDFEMARLDWRITEIIQTLQRFCFKRFNFDILKMKVFLQSYRCQTTLKFSELFYFPDVWEYLAIRNVVKNWYSYSKLKDKIILDKIRRSIKNFQWIKKNKIHLSKNLEKIIKM